MAGIFSNRLLLIGILGAVWTDSTANITTPPSSVVSPLYKLANFTCEGEGDRLTWTVQGFSLNESMKQYREISVTTNNISVGVLSSVLTIRALPINNGIIVGCTVLTTLLGIVQKGASFIVQG